MSIPICSLLAKMKPPKSFCWNYRLMDNVQLTTDLDAERSLTFFEGFTGHCLLKASLLATCVPIVPQNLARMNHKVHFHEIWLVTMIRTGH